MFHYLDNRMLAYLLLLIFIVQKILWFVHLMEKKAKIQFIFYALPFNFMIKFDKNMKMLDIVLMEASLRLCCKFLKSDWRWSVFGLLMQWMHFILNGSNLFEEITTEETGISIHSWHGIFEQRNKNHLQSFLFEEFKST